MDLIARIKNEDKPSLLTARGWPQGNITTLEYVGVPGMDWGLNCVHGVQSDCVDGICPSSFPSPPSLGASWNDTNVLLMSQIMGVEVRALWLAGAREPSRWSGRARIGLDCWSPNINLVRDPRWGRNQETATEDPMRNGRYAAAYTIGMQQGSDPRYLQSVTTIKHWAAYSLDDSDGFVRYDFNAVVSEYDMEDSYFPAFRDGIAGGAAGVMCSYNALNGTPTCASKLLRDRLRVQWNFTGYQTSDTGAITDFYNSPPNGHGYELNPHKAVCAALVDGETDIDSGDDFVPYLAAAVAKGYCNSSVVDRALYNTFSLRFRLGLFDPTEDQPYWAVPMSAVNTEESKAHNLRMAEEGIVLLKNKGVSGSAVLPLSRTEPLNIAVIGPSANDSAVLLPNYLGTVCPDGFGSSSCVETVLNSFRGLHGIAANFSYAHGCHRDGGNTAGFAAAVAAAKAADAVVLVMGLDQSLEAEMHDRTHIRLPGYQPELVSAIRSAVGPNVPIILVLINGGAIAIENELPAVDAVLEAWYPGPYGGKAIAKTIFGLSNPGGRLPVTMYPSSFVEKMLMDDMSMRGGVGRTYRYYKGTPIFAYGYGLSYSNLTGRAMVVQLGVADRWTVTVTVEDVTTPALRTWSRTTTVVQVYVQPLTLTAAPNEWPRRQLVKYERIEVNVNATWEVIVEGDDFCFVGADSVRQVYAGQYAILVSDGVQLWANRTVQLRADATRRCRQ